MTNKVVTRFAPSPTGPLHVGGVRSALFNYLFTKQNAGKIILRIEDTDKERSTKEFEKDILEGFEWLGLEFDETNRQSDRTGVYKKYIENLIADGKAFISKEEVTEKNTRPEVIRFKNPNQKIVFEDKIKGRIEFDTTELGNFVIAKSLEEPIFHLTNVIDDYEMGITNIIRGEDHISNTPRQILIWRAIGAEPPVYAHIPLIMAPDRSKLSKRKHGESVSLKYYRNRGYRPEALINFLALLGWNPGGDKEIFSLDELIKLFSLDRVQKGGAIFDVEKLNWMNREYLMKLPKEELIREAVARLEKSEKSKELLPAQKQTLSETVLDRLSFFGEIDDSLERGEYDYIFSLPEYDKNLLAWKDSPLSEAKTNIEEVLKLIDSLNEFPSKDEVKNLIWPYAESKGKGSVLWPMRFALAGKEKSLDPFSLVSILGKEETISRLQQALK